MLKLCIRGDYVIKLLNKYKLLFGLILLCMTSLLYTTFFKETGEVMILQEVEDDSVPTPEVVLEKEDLVEEKAYKLPVFICGAVHYPGVYEVDSTSLINDVLIEAGGFTEEANKEVINLAKIVSPNEKIYVPKVGEEIDKTLHSYENVERNDGPARININTADTTELEKLPGIGKVKAEQIISYRKENGLFKSQEELKNVSGIGEKTYQALQEHITIE